MFFRCSDVISTGDIFNTTNYPVIDAPEVAPSTALIAGVNHVIDLIIPVYGQEGGTMVIPGHGRLSDLATCSTTARWRRLSATACRT